MGQWLDTFPYHVVSLLVFVTSGVLVIIIASLPVSFQTIKAALLNSAKTLRYE